MKLWSISDVFSAPWKQTSEAVWKKYPNDQQPNVKTIDVLDRHVSPDGKLLTTRLFGSRFNFPSIIVSLLGMPDICYAIEYSEVDIKSQKMTLRMINSTFASVLSVDEKLVYTPNPTNPNATVLKQRATINISGIPFTDYFENMLIDRFNDTSKVGRSAVQKIVSAITVEHIINTVTEDLRKLACEADDIATHKVDEMFNLYEKASDLARDLDRASRMINNEITHFSETLSSEFEQILHSLEIEFARVTIKINFAECDNILRSSKNELVEAVVKAKIPISASNLGIS